MSGVRRDKCLVQPNQKADEHDANKEMKKFHCPLQGEEVGAVAGNVKVGNEVNMITRWQSIEYITSQNFDRRAFDLLNCITVVPGAIGAFRKEAILKALGVLALSKLAWTDMEVEHGGARPKVQLSGAIKDLAQEQQVGDILITLAHCRAYGVGYAIALKA